MIQNFIFLIVFSFLTFGMPAGLLGQPDVLAGKISATKAISHPSSVTSAVNVGPVGLNTSPHEFQRTIWVPQWETCYRTYNQTCYRNEQRQTFVDCYRKVCDWVPVNQVYTLSVPQPRTREVITYKTVPDSVSVEEEYTINVPETRKKTWTVYRSVTEQVPFQQ